AATRSTRTVPVTPSPGSRCSSCWGRARCSRCAWRPGAPTRSASTWKRSSCRSAATPSTASATTSSWSGSSCTRTGCGCAIRSAGRSSTWSRRCRPTWRPRSSVPDARPRSRDAAPTAPPNARRYHERVPSTTRRPARAGVPELSARFRSSPSAHDRKPREGGRSLGSRVHEGAAGGWSALRPPDAPLEPEDEAVHLHRARRHLHHRPAADPGAAAGGARLRAQRRRARRHRALRRHEEAGAGCGRRARAAGRHAVREHALAGRPAHQLAHDQRSDRLPARPAPTEAGRPARPAAREGAHPHARRAGEAGGEPGRRGRHAPPAGRRLHHRRAQGAARGARGAAAGHPRDRARGHELRPGRRRLRHPRQRRRHPLLHPDRARDRGRHRGREAAGDRARARARPARAGAGAGRRGGGGRERRRAGAAGGGGARARARAGARARQGRRDGGERGGGGRVSATEISAALVKELRDRTGAGMMECKRALVETNGDVEEAIRLLREKGMAAAGKRAGRATSEGLVATLVADGVGSIVGVGCETEPVSKNEALPSLEQERLELIGKLGENIVVVGAARFADGGTLAAYVHPPANKIGVLVALEGGSAELARQVAMHVSFAAPEWTAREDVPAEAVEAERQIFLNSDEVRSKPEAAREKIVDGMLAKRFFAASPGGVLLEQTWIHDSSKTVGQALAEAGASVKAFTRVSVASA